jgi:hypothetical protein
VFSECTLISCAWVLCWVNQSATRKGASVCSVGVGGALHSSVRLSTAQGQSAGRYGLTFFSRAGEPSALLLAFGVGEGMQGCVHSTCTAQHGTVAGQRHVQASSWAFYTVVCQVAWMQVYGYAPCACNFAGWEAE